jgi:hypothetical protein
MENAFSLGCFFYLFSVEIVLIFRKLTRRAVLRPSTYIEPSMERAARRPKGYVSRGQFPLTQRNERINNGGSTLDAMHFS